MRLLRAKIGGHFVLRNSGWFTIHPVYTSFMGSSGSGKSTLLRALRSINPPSCDGNQAPFAEYPGFAETTAYRRKILPAKKTAVIAVFVCGDPLREKLANIDPVYWQTDRIEVGRKLDNSRWITFVEIAASGRWSELVEEIGRLGNLAGQGRVAEEISAYLRAEAALLPTDRIKGELARECNDLLDRLAGHFASEEQQQQLQRVRQIANRAAHYQEAVKVVERSLPVFVYLDRGSLLSGIISDGIKEATKGSRQDKGGLCPDLILSELLGITPFVVQGGDQEKPSGQQGDQTRFDHAGRLLAARLSVYLPDTAIKLRIISAAQGLEAQASIGGSPFASLASLATPLRWVLSCAVCACYYSESEKRQVIFLLDEPDTDLSPGEKKELATFLLRLSGFHQLLVTTAAASSFPSAGGRQYRLKKDEGGSRVVDLGKRNRCGK